jgi:proteic killer suppression protein
MDVRFADDDLDRLEVDPRFTARLPAEVIRAYRKVLGFIRQATDERDLRDWKSLHFEKLTADREGQHSLRLNRQWRLVVELDQHSPSKTVVICAVENYHKD